MKHLKQIFESKADDTIIETLIDMLNEIVDLGYGTPGNSINVTPNYSINNNGTELSSINISINPKSGNKILLSDISDCVLRMVNYMDELDYFPLVENDSEYYSSTQELEKSLTTKKYYKGVYSIEFILDEGEDAG